ncbi:hypothetical protein MMC13_001565 [Lambiella insularis]|nr:hypothetical protein [Lambiella insularis]
MASALESLPLELQTKIFKHLHDIYVAGYEEWTKWDVEYRFGYAIKRRSCWQPADPSTVRFPPLGVHRQTAKRSPSTTEAEAQSWSKWACTEPFSIRPSPDVPTLNPDVLLVSKTLYPVAIVVLYEWRGFKFMRPEHIEKFMTLTRGPLYSLSRHSIKVLDLTIFVSSFQVWICYFNRRSFQDHFPGVVVLKMSLLPASIHDHYPVTGAFERFRKAVEENVKVKSVRCTAELGSEFDLIMDDMEKTMTLGTWTGPHRPIHIRSTKSLNDLASYFRVISRAYES